MPIQIHEESGANFVVIEIIGHLVATDYDQFIVEFDGLVRERGKLRALVDLTRLLGWDLGAAWEDTKFGVSHMGDFERLAVVGDRQWERQIVNIFRLFIIGKTQYFDVADSAAARSWLKSDIAENSNEVVI
ncbi:MAG: STAS/SEC14 domain-containing protein [Chthonomonadales bacterium]